MPVLDNLAHLNGYGLLVARSLLSLVFVASAYDKFRAPPCESAWNKDPVLGVIGVQ